MVSQVYVPDPAAVGQHLHEVAREMVSRGWKVHVIASAWGHHDASQRYRPREVLDGVEVERVPFGDLGKGSMKKRLAGSLLLLGQAMPRAVATGHVDHVLVSTSPPLAPPFGALLASMLGAKLTLWMMDINPDQTVVSTGISERALRVQALEQGVRFALARADRVVALDRFMAQRINRKLCVADKCVTIPPWPLAEQQQDVPHEHNPFRERFDLDAKRVIMYSGNISATHPVDTVLRGLQQLHAQDPKLTERLVLLFVGDGTGLSIVQQFCVEHSELPIRLLGYQPKDQLKYSLSAADVHLVSIGNDQVGIVHPCKVYGIMALGRPFLYLGPTESHIGDIVRSHGTGWQLAHGDVTGAVNLLRRWAEMPQEQLAAEGRHCRDTLQEHYAREYWLGRFCDDIESLHTPQGE